MNDTDRLETEKIARQTHLDMRENCDMTFIKKSAIGPFLAISLPIAFAILGSCVAYAVTTSKTVATIEARQDKHNEDIIKARQDMADAMKTLVDALKNGKRP